jgi:uncharacterized protein
MPFEWDEAKRRANIEKHRLDFRDIEALFDGRPVVTVPSRSGDEQRYLTTGNASGTWVTVVWTQRLSKIRLISARSARDGERRAYRAVHGG